MATIPQSPVVAPKVNGQAKPVQPSYAELVAKVKELEAKAAATRQTGTLTVRVMTTLSDGTPGKGGIGVYGLQRNPVTLYAEQWERLLAGVQAPEGSPVAAILLACKDPKATRK